MATEDGFSYLLPGHNEKHRRAPNWTDGEMKALLYVWEEHHNELKMSKRNAKVYEKMSQRFFQLTGEQRFKEEIKMKITNMSFQYRRLKSAVSESGETPDWPYYKPIEKILSKPLENGRVNSVEFNASGAGPSTSSQSTDNLVPQSDEGMMGFLPEYTGSSDEMEIKQELESLSSDSEHTQGSSQEKACQQAPIHEEKETASDAGHVAATKEVEPGHRGDVQRGPSCHAPTEPPAGPMSAAAGAHDEPSGEDDSASLRHVSIVGSEWG
ncbi:myb/SANT-like DNA-binding domain-containing protein 1 isoform X2 [Micropterus dolomieu]|uniref:myb/SANT-like DNA-binding domain-containing protein 1 isoform X2 n=1 Tax=Micropterus dolomieu TaxID=147949 RepID=UPI001E8E816E|nr:myb/SANT-like DNA-binding domain-containing protein 1 isoform X2 [Micropterus dolomieu]